MERHPNSAQPRPTSNRLTLRARLGATVAVAGCLLGICSAACYSGVPGYDPPGAAESSAAAEGGTSGPGPGGGPEEPADEGCSPLPSRIWKLTPHQYARTIVDLLPLAGEVDAIAARVRASLPSPDGVFSNHAERRDTTQLHVDALLTMSDQWAELVVAQRSAWAGCLEDAAPSTDCVAQFLDAFGARAFRRPLHDAERERFVEFYRAEASSSGEHAAFEQLVRAILLSPSFLYRSELGAPDEPSDRVQLTAYELASELSYFLTDGPPDQALRDAADRGELSSPAQRREHAARLLSGSIPGLLSFFLEQLELRSLDGVDKDDAIYPEFSDALAEAMEEETQRFIEHVLTESDGRLSTLLSANYTFVNADLAEVYDVAGPSSSTEYARAELPSDQRAGLLTQAALMSVLSDTAHTSIVLRGKYIREHILCQGLPSPPENVDVTPVIGTEDQTQRERLELEHSVGDCAACHALMDPLGFPFERYDAIGGYREVDEHGLPIDRTGSIIGTDVDGPVSDAVDLAHRLASSQVVHECFSTQLATWAYGGPEPSAEACGMTEARRSEFFQSGGDLRALIIDLVSAEAFATRRRTDD